MDNTKIKKAAENLANAYNDIMNHLEDEGEMYSEEDFDMIGDISVRLMEMIDDILPYTEEV